MNNSLYQEYSAQEIEVLKALTPKNISTTNTSLRKLIHMKHRIHIFDGINSNEIKKLVENVNFRRYKNKEYIIKENDTSKEIFILLSGNCQVIVKKHSIGLLSIGQTFGEVAAIFNTKRNASILSISDNTLVLSFKLKDNIIDALPYATALLYKNLAQQINRKLEFQNKLLSR